MENQQSGARKQRGKKETGEVLSEAEAAKRAHGQEVLLVVRIAARLAGMKDDQAIADALGGHVNTVTNWGKGAEPKPSTMRQFAKLTNLPVEPLFAFVYDDGPPPHLDWTRSGVLEGAQRDQDGLDGAGPGTPVQPPKRPPHGSGGARQRRAGQA